MHTRPRTLARSTFLRGLTAALLLAPLLAHAQDLDGDVAAPGGAGGGDRGLAPYLYVAGGDPDVDRLPLADVKADIQVAGVIAHVRVHQVFANRAAKPIEAVYVFPASTRAAVHRMRMTIGARVVEAKIDRRAQAAATYEQAKSEGRRTSLLEQERENVFTMKVANVVPGDRIAIDLDYSEMLIPEDGVYEVVFPATVGPRYTGGMNPAKDGWASTAHLPAGRPEPYAYDVTAHVESGVPLASLASPSHEVDVARRSPAVADVRLRKPGGGDRDYVLRYRLAGDRIQTGALLSPPTGPDGEGYFALMVEPPRAATVADAPPREYVFLVDVSGSMFGFPLDTAKELIGKLFDGLRAQDTFNVVLFAGGSRVLGPEGSLPATRDNLRRALALLGREQGGGGTELLAGLQAAYGVPGGAGARSRSVVVITDGYVGVEAETFRFVRERLDHANLFAFGIGSSVNRSLIEGMARAGMGEPFVVLNATAAPVAAERFRKMIERPLLAQVRVEIDGVDAFDQAPRHLPDLLAARPLVVFGKYRGRRAGRAVITGAAGRGPFRAEVALDPAAGSPSLGALEWLWARKQVAWLEDERSIARGAAGPIDERIAELGLRHRLLTSQTSFVAVDEVVANPGGRQETSNQPLPMPAGVSNLAVASVAVSRTNMPPGDPVLSVPAEATARAVTAYFPFGLVKELRYDAGKETWEARFLVPKQTPDGVYEVPVVITHADGRQETVRGRYTIDGAEPDFDLEVEPVAGGVRLRVVTAEPARRVIAADVAAPGHRVELERDAGDGGDGAGDGRRAFAGTLRLPPGRHIVRVVVADLARNEAEHTVTVEVP